MKMLASITKKLLTAILYGIIGGVGINLFLAPYDMLIGGVTGAAQLAHSLAQTAGISGIDLGIWIFLFNIPPAVIALIFLGKGFTLVSFAAVLSLSLSLKIIPVSALSGDAMLSAVIGGALVGLGSGLCFRFGFCTGGIDFIILVIQKKANQTVGQISLVINGLIALAAGFIFGIETALYSIIVIFISNLLLNACYTQQYKITLSIFTRKRREVTEMLRRHSVHGVSYTDGLRGGYTDDEVSLVITVVSRYELIFLRDMLKKTDPDAFVNIQPTDLVIGKFMSTPVHRNIFGQSK